MPCVKVKADKATTNCLMQALFKSCIIIVILRNLKWPNEVLKCFLFLMSELLIIINIGRLLIHQDKREERIFIMCKISTAIF